jgi:GMP synthase-like glutamine amidotransferase
LKPVAILQHAPDVGPGYFETWLRELGLPYRLIRIDQGTAVPRIASQFAGIASMGGPMSVNDPLAWIEDECALLREADAAGVPVIGHCLGGQMLAKALGVPVRVNPVKEIGWGPVEVTDSELARDWLGTTATQVEVFQWHGDTFDLPPGARNFLGNRFCARQAYVIDRGRYAHLGMQFHCEMTTSMIREWLGDGTGSDWCREVEEERRLTGAPAIQRFEQILDRVDERVARMNSLAARLYLRWARGLAA